MTLPAHLAEPYERYWRALGHFIDEFATVEHHIHAALHHFARVPDDVGRVVFSGHRIKDGVDTINRLLEARGLRRAKLRLAPTFAQLGEINETRNNIVHWGSMPIAKGSSDRRISNARLVQKGRAVKEYSVSLDTFAEMSRDLLKIGVHLEVEISPERVTREMYRELYRPLLRSSWRYKPPQRAVPPGKTPKGSQGRQRQQRSSEASAQRKGENEG